MNDRDITLNGGSGQHLMSFTLHVAMFRLFGRPRNI